MTPTFRVRNTLVGTNDDFKTRADADRFIAVHDLAHYELWETSPGFRLIEYGSTPTRIKRQGVAA